MTTLSALNLKTTTRPMLDQAMSAITVIFSTRGGELAELIKGAGGSSGSTSASTDPGQGDANSNAATEPEGGCGAGRGGPASDSRLGSLDGFDGIVVVGGDGTFFEVWCVLAFPYVSWRPCAGRKWTVTA